jgi:hypothetical protein
MVAVRNWRRDKSVAVISPLAEGAVWYVIKP